MMEKEKGEGLDVMLKAVELQLSATAMNKILKNWV